MDTGGPSHIGSEYKNTRQLELDSEEQGDEHFLGPDFDSNATTTLPPNDNKMAYEMYVIPDSWCNGLIIPENSREIMDNYIWHKENFTLQTTNFIEHGLSKNEIKTQDQCLAGQKLNWDTSDLRNGQEQKQTGVVPVKKITSSVGLELETRISMLEKIKFKTIFGSLKFGDCIDDEWFSVFILVQLSRYNPVIISVSDNDGQFLLIEAAEVLPPNLEPHLTDNRIFIFGGHLHIIPLDYKDLCLGQSLSLILDDAVDTQANIDIERCAFSKIEGFPVKQLLQKTQIWVPHRVAHILHHCPSLIAPAADAFYHRDFHSMKYCNKMTKFSSNFDVMTTTKMTRIVYAQLKSSHFIAPIKFTLPFKSHPKYFAAEMGMKITCGFEILYQSLIGDQKTASSNPEYRKYKERLASMGYFKGQLEGSSLYKELEQAAQTKYLEQNLSNNRTMHLLSELSSLSHIDEAHLVNILDLNQEEPDSDEWLGIDPSDIDDIIETKMASNISDESSDSDSETLSLLDPKEEGELAEISQMLDGVEGFLLEKESGIKGALLPDEDHSENDEETTMSLDSSSSEGDEDETPISLDADVYMNKLLNASGQPSTRENDSIESLMEAMDQELSKCHIDKDHFQNDQGSSSKSVMAENIISSIEAQQGLPGPGSSMIASLGFKVPFPL